MVVFSKTLLTRKEYNGYIEKRLVEKKDTPLTSKTKEI